MGRLNGLSACPAAKPHAPQLLFIVSCEMPMHQVHIGLDCSLLPSLYFLNCQCIESMFMLDLIAAYSLLISCTTLVANCICIACELLTHQVHIGLICSLLFSLVMHHTSCLLYLVNRWCIESMLDWIAAYSLLMSCTTTLADCIS